MRDIVVRRLGTNACHAAQVPADLVYEATIWGAGCEAIDGPVAARCGLVVRGHGIIVMREGTEPSRCCARLAARFV